VRRHIHIGHALRDARKERGWNQEQLGEAARKIVLPGGDDSTALERINKFTVSKAERDPYPRKYATLARLAGALGRTVADLEEFARVKPLLSSEAEEKKTKRKSA
jgi:transcriptional regulator with XRE-family HTH domain